LSDQGDTHRLFSAEARTNQDIERNQTSEQHSLPVEQGRNKSGMTPKETEQVRDTHTLWGVEGGTSQDTEMSKREVLTSCRAQMEQQVRILKETERARHSLPVARKGRCKSGHQRNRTSEGYSPRSEHRGSDKSGH